MFILNLVIKELNMPKHRRDRSLSIDASSNPYPFPCPSTHPPPLAQQDNDKKLLTLQQWDSARCPVCLEHPHNAVLLICSSHHNGCRPFMCDTSYRHSNCLDQFRNSNSSHDKNTHTPPPVSVSPLGQAIDSTRIPTEELQQEEISVVGASVPNQTLTKPNLLCPLCRGQINGWVVEEPARVFMNAKLRTCSCETCEFSGTYSDLRKHARVDHPSLRPCQADPERERRWRRLERQRDFGDLLSTLQSSFGEERVEGETSFLPVDDGGLLTVFFLIQVFRPATTSSRSGSSWSGTSRARAQLSVRRRSTRLWGESYDRHTESTSRDEDNDASDGGSGPFRRRTRRRTTPDNQE